MAEDADAGFMIWDDRSPGTLNNVLNLLSLSKQSLVYANTTDEFLWITGTAELQTPVDRIPIAEREIVNEKIGLSERMQDLFSRRSYDIQPVSHSVGEVSLIFWGQSTNQRPINGEAVAL